MIPHAMAESMGCSLKVLAGAALSTSSKRERPTDDEQLNVEARPHYQTQSHLEHRQCALYDEDDPMIMHPDHQDIIPITYKQGYMPFHRDPSARKTSRKNRSSYESICNDSPIDAPEPSFSEGGQNSTEFHVPSQTPHHFSHEARPSEHAYDQPHTYTTDTRNARFLPDESAGLQMGPQMQHFMKYSYSPSLYSSKGHHPADSRFEHDAEGGQPSCYTYSSSAYEHSRAHHPQSENVAEPRHTEEALAYASQARSYYSRAAPSHSYDPSASHEWPEQPVQYLVGHKQASLPPPSETRAARSHTETRAAPGGSYSMSQRSGADHTHSAYPRDDRYFSPPQQIPHGGHGNLYSQQMHAESYAHQQMRHHTMMMMRIQGHEPPAARPDGQAPAHPPDPYFYSPFHRSKAHRGLGVEQTYICGHCNRQKTSTSSCSDGRVRIRCECGGQHHDGKARMHATWTCVPETQFSNRDNNASAGGPNKRMVRYTARPSVPISKKIIFIDETGQKKRKRPKTKASTPSAVQDAAVCAKPDVKAIGKPEPTGEAKVEAIGKPEPTGEAKVAAQIRSRLEAIAEANVEVVVEAE